MEKRREAKNSLSLLFSAGSSSLSLSLSLSLNFSLSRQNTLSLRPCARVVLLLFLCVKGQRERKVFRFFSSSWFRPPFVLFSFFFSNAIFVLFLSIIFLHKRAQKTALCARFLPLATHERRGENTRFFARVNNERERETLFGVDFVRLFLFSREREREFFLER